ncbi:MAG TPA: hypothetical protein PK971_00305 [Saprospiraceae bacterium]|nr:hypothetical protein [Saprospiraceae bacterium]HND86731.1 hypothetical protein [Saprospiraceae bacterium]
MRILSLLMLLACAACQPTADPKALTVAVEQTQLYTAPDWGSPALELLLRGDPLSDLGKVSPFEMNVQYGADMRQAPWIAVQTPSGKSGWVFGGAVVPPDLNTDWLLQKRLLCYFGPTLTARRNALAAPTPPTDEAALASRYRATLALRDTLLLVIAHRPEPGHGAAKPQFFWLKNALPGTLFQQVSGGALPWLFMDYRAWLRWASQSSGPQDDLFFSTCANVFPADSIESPFPAWLFPLSEREAVSRLGEGRHLATLQAIDRAWRDAPLFRPELATIKEQIIDDILSQDSRYWQPKDKIVKELENIWHTPLQCLEAMEQEMIWRRIALINQAEQHGIRVNLRSGEMESGQGGG